MKKLKKYSIFILILIGLTACSKEKIELPKSKELESIKVTEVIKEKIIKFSIEAYEKDKKIGDAEHTRVIINNTKFLEKLNN